MTMNERLAAIRARAESATIGPWVVYGFGKADADFIVNASDDVSWLLAREASLRQVLIDLVKALHACKSSIDAAFLMQYVHGARHTGPTYGKELARAEEVLKGEAREDAD